MQSITVAKDLSPNNNNKELSAYNTKLPMGRTRKSEFPRVRMLQTISNSKEKPKEGNPLIMESRSKILSLYDSKNEIPYKSKLSLSKKKEKLEKICSKET